MRNCIGLAIVAASFGACVAVSAQSAGEPLPPPVVALLTQGQAAAAAGNVAAALADYKKADKLANGGSATCAIFMARTEADMGHYPDALKDAKRATLISTTPAMARQAEGNYATLLTRAAGFSNPHDKRLQQAETEYRLALAGDAPDPAWELGLGRVLLCEGKDADGIAELNRLLSMPAAPTALAVEARALIANPRRAREPIAPAFSFTALDGSTVNSQELRGKVLLIDFWATWCEPCRDAVPMLVMLQRKFQRQGDFVIVGISSDTDAAAWKSFVSSHNMTWTQYLDLGRTIQLEYGVFEYPTYLVVDRDGVIRLRQAGEPDYTPGELEAAIGQALKQKPALAAAPAN